MILQWGGTIKVSTELPVATRHRRDMTEKLLKAMLNPNTHTYTQKNYVPNFWTILKLSNTNVTVFSHSYFLNNFEIMDDQTQ